MAHGMVCAPQPEAVEAGVLALEKGGNAVDAAVACALVQTAVDPQMCGIAGFGSAVAGTVPCAILAGLIGWLAVGRKQ